VTCSWSTPVEISVASQTILNKNVCGFPQCILTDSNIPAVHYAQFHCFIHFSSQKIILSHTVCGLITSAADKASLKNLITNWNWINNLRHLPSPIASHWSGWRRAGLPVFGSRQGRFFLRRHSNSAPYTQPPIRVLIFRGCIGRSVTLITHYHILQR
jgi:hypothetical protein